MNFSHVLLARWAVALALLIVMPGSVLAEVYHSKESALRLAFPGADDVQAQDLFLSEVEAQRIADRAGAKLPSRMVTVYEGRREGACLGYAMFETHTVRTLPETLMLVMDPGGSLRAVHMLAFHEPPEYEPTQRWLDQFTGRRLDDDLSLRRDVAGIAGSTLTATAVTASVRRGLAILEEKIQPEVTALTPSGMRDPNGL